MDAISVLWWIIVGGIAGWLASVLVQGRGLGLVGDVIVGIIGAVIGGWLFGSTGGGTLMTIIVAFLGAVILLAIIKLVRRI